MTCDEAKILLHALLDNELDAGHAREVEAHIASCASCAAEFAAQGEMQRMLADSKLRYTAPAGLRTATSITTFSPRAKRVSPGTCRGSRAFQVGEQRSGT